MELIFLGDHIRKTRLDLGLTQTQVADIVGVTESTVWNWEHGTQPDSKHHSKITQFLSESGKITDLNN